MSGHETARRLLDAARTDFKALGNMLDRKNFHDHTFGFLTQQTVENALKAWLYVLLGSHPFTHDLSLLIQSLENGEVAV